MGKVKLTMLLTGLVLCGAAFGATGQGFTDVFMLDVPEHEIRYTSGRTIYVEALVDGRWAGRYWTAAGGTFIC